MANKGIVLFEKKKLYFTHNILIRKEHFGTLILPMNGYRFEIDNELFEKLQHVQKNNYWPGLTENDISTVSKLIELGILTEDISKKGIAKLINNPFISEDCLSFPRTVYWECTEKCNYRCVHCYSSSGGKGSFSGMSFDQVKKLIDELDKKGVEFLSIGGGEPLMFSHIYKTIAYARKKGLAIEMTSNGSLLNKKRINKLKESGLKFLQISFDGITEKTYEQIRPGGHFLHVIECIKEAAKYFTLSICTVANKLNILEIPDIIDFSKKVGAQHYRVLPLMAVGRGKAVEHLMLSTEELRELNMYISERRRKDKDINIQLNENLVLPEQKNITWMPSGHFGCSAGRTTCSIDAKGNVYPCSFMEHPSLVCGNIIENSLEEIWRNSKVLKRLRELDHLNGVCGNCKYLEKCRGGCRASAYLRNLKMDDSDYLCSINR
ncbi:MAG: radical SAM protein [Candidatus Heimdallarchaeota archaeon]|nr:radical SAM protein [Candidatus Heimdallarchaeota archaeon]